MTLWIDSETYSPLSLPKSGTHRYAEPAEIMLSSFSFDDDAPTVIDHTTGEKLPKDVVSYLTKGGPKDRIRISNSAFDRTLYRHAMGLIIPVSRIDDLMVIALQHSLPGSLDMLCKIFQINEEDAKHQGGKDLIHLFCKPQGFKCEVPRGLTKAQAALYKERMKRGWTGRATRISHPQAWEQFKAYAGNDIRAMQVLWPKLPKWNHSNEFERTLWELDQRINDRGFAVDLDLARAAIEAVKEHQDALALRTQDLTDNEVQKATQRDALLRYILESFGVHLPDMRKATLERRINDPDLPWAVRELLSIRLDASAASVSKYDALMRTVSSDGRLRNTIQFCGASRTGRDAGRIFQPQNVARPSVKQPVIDMYVDAFKDDYINLLVTNPIQAAADCLRSSIVAAPGKKLGQADLSNIEGRHLAWQAGEEWKLQAFRDYDTIIGEDDRGKPIRKGHDLYVLAFAKSFGVEPEEVDSDDRQKGKVQELALGFEGGVGAFVAFSLVYGINLEDMANNAWPRLSPAIKKDTEWGWKWACDKRLTFGLSEKVYRVCEAFKILWRRAHPNVVQMWKDYKEAMTAAILNPGHPFEAGRMVFERPMNGSKPGTWTYITLPSGRRLCYPQARVDDGQISYMGVNSYSRKWQRIKTFGGKIAENCIAGGTLILQEKTGWTPIQDADSSDRVWDGEKWVSFSHVSCKGRQYVIEAHGVVMTPDHQVLTTEGWKDGASSSGFERFPCGLPDRYKAGGKKQCRQDFMGIRVRVRKHRCDARNRVYEAGEKRNYRIMRMHERENYFQEKRYTQFIPASPVCGMERDDGKMLQENASRIPQLWSTRDHRFGRLARFYDFLQRRIGWMEKRAFPGPGKQRPGIQQRQLQVGYTGRTGQQPKNKCMAGHPQRKDDHFTGGKGFWDKKEHNDLASLPRMESTAIVYDLVNCGPDSRFVVMDKDGGLLVVHNCDQAGSRDIFMHSIPKLEAANYPVILRVHDEVVCEVPDTEEYSYKFIERTLATNPAYAPGLPLAAAGWEAHSYRKG